jgi:EAL domain-containing protein (putative c-di-GMP-specific phosphodiesterase class I)
VNEQAIVRVVVVDDHEMILQSVVRLLAADSHIVVVGTALTGVEGIEVTKRVNPDVLVLDYHLPDMDAPEVIRKLQEANSQVKVVTLSGSERPGAFYASMSAGSSAWVRKTRAIHELRDAIRHVAAGWPCANDEIEALPKRDELVVHYQPVVSLDDGRIVGFESLARWQHPERGLLYPESFLPYAEETGFTGVLDRWVREVAVRQLASWQQQFPSDPHLWMSVNISGSDLVDPNLLASISQTLADHGLNPSELVVEITESLLLDDSSSTMDFLTGLKALGLGLAIDDFGTAFSSISYLRRFPFDHLKLDISFTAELPHSIRSMLLVEEIWRMSHSLGMSSIAEGIENQSQLDALRDIGWKFGQGYFFSRPVTASECDALLARSSLLPV